MAGRFRRRRFFRSRRRFGARRLVRKIRKISRNTIRRMSEVKWANNNANLTSAGNVINITEITPGTAIGPAKIGETIGNRLKYKYGTLTGNCYVTFNGDEQAVLTVRVALVHARVSNLVATDVITAGTFSTTNIWQPFIGTNVRVVRDWKFNLSILKQPFATPGPIISMLPSVKKFKSSRRLNNNVTKRDGSNIVTSDPQDKIYLIWGFVPSILGYLMNLNYFHRVSYIDI